ncbi:MAG: glycosyltransferase [Phaeodactylibacter sp.]|nr:glycosyltransferase [Phaeodactylibacter sp.]
MTTILALFSVLALAYLAFGVAYQLFFAAAGLFYRQPGRPLAPPHHRIAVFIPAYREDAVILSSARQALEHDYPARLFDVIVIADGLQEGTLEALRTLPLKLVEVAFEQSTKSRAINRALELLPEAGYDIVVILDADNVMGPGFLSRVSGNFGQGSRVVQGQRAAKNADTPMAVLDGASEAINNHILCKGQRVLGFSARLAGSAMAFDYALFREVMPQIDAIGGFDKELELRLTQRGLRIAYDEEAIVYDEKVRREADFSRQRSRWIAAQFHYARRFFPRALQQWLADGNGDFMNKATQMLLPPRLITPGVLAMGALAHLPAGAYLLAALWGGVLLANILSFMLAMPGYLWRSPYRQALLGLPRAFFYALRSLLGLNYARRHFINTPHGDNE